MQNTVNDIALEEKLTRQSFLSSLKSYGGVYDLSTVSDFFSIEKQTIIELVRQKKLIALKWGSTYLFPIFQFSTHEGNSEKGMLKGIPELLSLITHNVSAVRKCNFFTKKIEIPGEEEKTSILNVLQKGSSEEQMKYFRLLAQNFGTNNLM